MLGGRRCLRVLFSLNESEALVWVGGLLHYVHIHCRAHGVAFVLIICIYNQGGMGLDVFCDVLGDMFLCRRKLGGEMRHFEIQNVTQSSGNGRFAYERCHLVSQETSTGMGSRTAGPQKIQSSVNRSIHHQSEQ